MSRRPGHSARKARRFTSSASPRASLFRSCFLAMEPRRRSWDLSRQWAAPAPGEPFRFGGSLRPAGLSPELEYQLRRAAEAITAACGLRGLNSIDFLVEGSEYTLIEVNPRPGATLDIFEDRGGVAFPRPCRVLPRPPAPRPLEFAGAAAAGIAYARREISSMPAIRLARLDVGPAESAERIAAARPFVHDKGPRGKTPARPRARQCADQFDSRPAGTISKTKTATLGTGTAP